MPPRALSATYEAIAKRARRRGYVVRKTGLANTMTRENAVVVGPAQLSELAAYLENCHQRKAAT